MKHKILKKLIFSSVLRDSTIILLISGILAFSYNAISSKGLELLAKSEYQILVPCPEILGEIETIEADNVLINHHKTLLIDARSAREYTTWHLKNAINIPYDFLLPTPDSAINNLLASKANQIVVYGDGGNPDLGRELGRELAGRGIRNVMHVKGGVKELKRHLEVTK